MDSTWPSADSGPGGFLGAVAAPLIVPASPPGRGGTTLPSDGITFGVMDAETRGPYETPFHVPLDECEVVATCDVQGNRRTAFKDKLEKPLRGTEITHDIDIASENTYASVS